MAIGTVPFPRERHDYPISAPPTPALKHLINNNRPSLVYVPILNKLAAAVGGQPLLERFAE